MRMLTLTDEMATKIQDALENGYAITVTKSCEECDFLCKAACGKKPCCDHSKIKSKRPYADDYDKNKSRKIEFVNLRPAWCPLNEGDDDMKIKEDVCYDCGRIPGTCVAPKIAEWEDCSKECSSCQHHRCKHRNKCPKIYSSDKNGGKK